MLTENRTVVDGIKADDTSCHVIKCQPLSLLIFVEAFQNPELL